MNRASSWPLLLGAATFLAIGLAFGNVLRTAQTRENVGLIVAPPLAMDKLNFDLVKAAAQGNGPRFKVLLAQGTDINHVYRGNSVFQDDYVGSNGVISGMSALSAASDTRGHLDAVKFLIAHGADVNRHDDNDNANNWTPIMHAIWCDDRSVLKFLVKAGADVNATAQADETVLMIAAEGGTPEAVDLLLAAGAKLNAVDADGDTALTEAANAQILKALLSHGATARGKYGQKALWNVIGRDDVAGVRLLLDAGADVNSRDDQGQTPLMLACHREYGEGWLPAPEPAMVKLLIASGASIQTKDKQGETAMAHIKNNPFWPDLDPDGRKRDMAAIRLLKQAEASE